ncbi:MAG: PhzF family phenazine biosynthesis protein [Bacteroidota bacterium]
MKKAAYYLLDVFTKEKFHGNPLAIFPDARWIDTALLQPIAAELNLSETVFLYPKDASGVFPMRIFTPKMELPIAGHPTIGTGFFLSRELDHPVNGSISFLLKAKIGEVPVVVTFEDNVPQTTRMTFPRPTFGEVLEDRQMLTEVLGLSPDDLLELPTQAVSCGVPFLIIPLRSIDAVQRIRFNMEIWQRYRKVLDPYFIYAFAPQGELATSQLHGRMFAPQAGILEDPATGAANAPLAAYCHHYGVMSGPLVSEQGFEMGRRSLLEIEAHAEEKGISGVSVGGDCVFVGAGELFID